MAHDLVGRIPTELQVCDKSQVSQLESFLAGDNDMSYHVSVKRRRGLLESKQVHTCLV